MPCMPHFHLDILDSARTLQCGASLPTSIRRSLLEAALYSVISSQLLCASKVPALDLTPERDGLSTSTTIRTLYE